MSFTLHVLKHHFFFRCRSLITDLHAKCQPVWIFTLEWRGNAAQPVMTNECRARLVACLLSVPGVCSRAGCMKSSVWPWDGRLKPELPPPHLNVGHLKKSEAPPLCSFLFVCSFSPLYLSVHPSWCQKKVGKYQDPPPASPPLFSSYFQRTHIQKPLAIGHWTASLSVSLVKVNTTREGAKTKVLLRGIHCVNILAGELHKGKGGTVWTIYWQKEQRTGELFNVQFTFTCTRWTNQ